VAGIFAGFPHPAANVGINHAVPISESTGVIGEHPAEGLTHKVRLLMQRSLYLGLLCLVLCTVSCTQSPFIPWPPSHSRSQMPPGVASQQDPEPAENVPSRPCAGEEEATTPTVSTQEQAPAPAYPGERPEMRETEEAVQPKRESYTDQKRIDDALDIYQEALDYWNRGELEKAIHSLDRSYQIICTVCARNDPEITQQQEDLRLLISRRILEIYASRSQPQIGGSRELPLAMNEYVAREIKRFQTSERTFFIYSYRRSGRYRSYIVEQLKEAGLPEDLSWLPLIESGYKTKALSKARALGLWQFIASTAYRFDLRRDRWVDERMDPQCSTRAAIAYLKALHDLFGDWTTVLAAYNCGEGNVLRVIREQHVNYLDDFWDLYPRLPQETARYVPRFLAALHIIKHPDNYGFTGLELDEPLSCDRVKIERQMRLGDIARVLTLPVQELEERNPSLRYKATPDYPFTLKVPDGTRAVLLAKLDRIPTWRPPKRAYALHRVRFGETLSEIALKYRVPLWRIVRANHLRSASRIRAGQRLKIPLRAGMVVASSDSSQSTVHYRVKRGDSLWLIARRFNTTVAEIKALNGIQSDLLRSGQLIRIQRDSR
jgi:membrane-bound lytic murein transglycosylase D